jgi:hypothetical protein
MAVRRSNERLIGEESPAVLEGWREAREVKVAMRIPRWAFHKPFGARVAEPQTRPFYFPFLCGSLLAAVVGVGASVPLDLDTYDVES